MDGVAGANLLLDQADRLFAAHVDRATLAGADRGEWPDALWRAVEDAGLPLALVPEAAGGVGFSAEETLQVVRRAAFHAIPLPLAETMLAAALWAEVSGALAEGVLTLAPGNATDRIGIRREGNGFVLEGVARRVPWGARAAHILTFARDESGQGWLALVPAASVAAATTGRRSVANEPRDTVRLGGVVLAAGLARPAPARLQADGAMPLGAALRVQQMVGAMERAMDHALAYANERVQFGRPIAKFQAVQHMLAIAAGHLAAATAAADAMAERVEGDGFASWVAVAKARTGEAAGIVAATSHQVHAAMGFTQEHPLHYVTRRLWSWRDEFGGEAFWQQRLGEAACRAGGDALWPMLSAS